MNAFVFVWRWLLVSKAENGLYDRMYKLELFGNVCWNNQAFVILRHGCVT